MISNYKVVLQIRIERARKRLHLQVQKHGLGHPRVLEQSMRLDELINQYNRLGKEKIKKPIA
ncbi:Spo0E family sporulation regulatory protein-aspartic acid phosphatase [Paenibacillus medicaginis]|uniref:Spo0E family sporulation regulatory protein-aspartic acid phosphatase n=1 Tax=Paenibacillus medicaginis TaxID=1470560 RepID=A0ABV5BWQ0_9BACL